MPIVSVVIITHNREKLIKQAIDSVLSQNFSNFELIIIDDASTDKTEEILKEYSRDNRVRYFKISKRKSIAEVRNEAWKHVKGDYVAILDSDDIWVDRDKLSKQYNILKDKINLVLVGSSAVLINNKGEDLKLANKPINDKDIRKIFFEKNPFFHSSVMYRLNDVKNIGGYDETIKFGEDLDLWMRLGKIGNFYNFPEPMIKYRVHSDNEASKHTKTAIFDVFKIISKNRKDYKVGRSVFLKKILSKLREIF